MISPIIPPPSVSWLSMQGASRTAVRESASALNPINSPPSTPGSRASLSRGPRGRRRSDASLR